MRRLLVLAVTAAAALLVMASSASAAGSISSLSVSPDSVRNGAASQGTVTLAFPDPAATTALLFSSDPSVASVPASVVIPAGATSATFPIATNAAAPATIVQITAAIANVPRTANLSVNAATPAGPSLQSVSVTPSSVAGGGAATGTVRFTGATDGADVQLASSNPALVRVPADTVVNGGQSTGAFAVSTSPVTATTTVTITASWFGDHPHDDDHGHAGRAARRRRRADHEGHLEGRPADDRGDQHEPERDPVRVLDAPATSCSRSRTRAAGDTPTSVASSSTRCRSPCAATSAARPRPR